MEQQEMECEQCGRRLPAEQAWLDEESGLWLCPLCQAEEESCGCSGDEQ